ncbi:hypothetical protein BOC42_28815 [Burkholderia pseudomallei]|nr:hypothetical protein BOC37_01815 [Burkholderia pseudomallei]ARK71024.1 hypothetical protein BOC38_31575 [Burkholderia pseudomallei]ARK74252.1 hypothetical protein BOC39_11985 [Burkholderia pseudomallei]ARK91211.1 hypothetical protein BOC42_28815 [Burkholderia pseudomallei]ARL11961.1 hypothetical protein BOC45_25015 [Burkholderia pseudomallei]
MSQNGGAVREHEDVQSGRQATAPRAGATHARHASCAAVERNHELSAKQPTKQSTNAASARRPMHANERDGRRCAGGGVGRT